MDVLETHGNVFPHKQNKQPKAGYSAREPKGWTWRRVTKASFIHRKNSTSENKLNGCIGSYLEFIDQPLPGILLYVGHTKALKIPHLTPPPSLHTNTLHEVVKSEQVDDRRDGCEVFVKDRIHEPVISSSKVKFPNRYKGRPLGLVNYNPGPTCQGPDNTQFAASAN
ncbi:hypothetical protein OSB04_001156 [Centaurea solstitialis]|uniref:Uncharacterized protein n=1 Tax=Centaurea solstitialis TaxID=347529 RepID=A0AA38WSI2_9ASTR|nr:hypothetical protein OSB04_001156 [Centaurea solstitialis]